MLAKMEEENKKLEESHKRGPHEPVLGKAISHTLILAGTFASVFRNNSNSFSPTRQVRIFQFDLLLFIIILG